VEQTLVEEATSTRSAANGPVTQWILTHDDQRLFTWLYIGLALVLSITLGLFWLVAVVAVHGGLEMFRQRYIDPRWPGVIARTLWELKLDLSLIIFAFVVTLYIDVIFGFAGVGAGVRTLAKAGARGGSKLAAWQKVLRSALLSLDDAAQVARAALSSKSADPAATLSSDSAQNGLASSGATVPTAQNEPTLTSQWGAWAGQWSLGDRISLSFGSLCLLLILLAPLITGTSATDVIATIFGELHPFPGE
jgi:hypothetical protein